MKGIKMKSTQYFYQNLKAFEDFRGLIESSNYQSMPSDWYVVITDVKGSTKAIEAGRYKDVNTVGVASIVLVQNAIKDLEIPYVFGGDGASMIIPPEHIEKVKSELKKLKNLSVEHFDLELRVGIVQIKELEPYNVPIEVAKFKIFNQKSVAFFKGGGLTKAEEIIKDPNSNCELVVDSKSIDVDLKGLSCRWQPIPNKNGYILSILIMTRNEDSNSTYDKIISELNHIFNGEIEEANPVNLDNMSYRSFKQSYKDERRYHDSAFSLSFIMRVAEIFLAVLIFKLNIPPLIFNSKKYAHSMKTHSDYRKFDDMLRMVVDCSEEQKNKIEGFLEGLYQSGEVFYGTFASNNALMTCVVEDVKDGEHIHFIDGGDGGYALAAKQLKAQIKKEKSEKQ